MHLSLLTHPFTPLFSCVRRRAVVMSTMVPNSTVRSLKTHPKSKYENVRCSLCSNSPTLLLVLLDLLRFDMI